MALLSRSTGAVALVASLLAMHAAPAATFETLYSFTGTDGEGPGELVVDQKGALFGATAIGGSNACTDGCGTLFKLSPPALGWMNMSLTRLHWTLTTLHTFTGPDGEIPYGGLVFDDKGALYGTTDVGGPGGYGTVFKFDPETGRLTTLHAFSGPDGQYPQERLVIGTSGVVYGTTFMGGKDGIGTVFKLVPPSAQQTGWVLTTLHSFTLGDGSYPVGNLAFDEKGALYGTTEPGRANTHGTVFRFDAVSGRFTTLHSFKGTDGAWALGGVVFGDGGALYGSTEYGGTSPAGGTVFELDPATGKLTTLHDFTEKNTRSGYQPIGAVRFDKQGALFGTTGYGGAWNQGTIFRLTPPKDNQAGWAFTTLHSFQGPDGVFPNSIPSIDRTGALYGTTIAGGASANCSGGCGTVFRISP